MGGQGGALGGGEGLGDVIAELERLVERLGELAYEELRRAVDMGEEKRPDLERRLTRARNAVERAAGILRSSIDDR